MFLIFFSIHNSQGQDTLRKLNNYFDISQNTRNILPLSEFTLAGHRRFLPDGSLPNKVTNFNLLPTSIVVGSIAGLFLVQKKIQKNMWGDPFPFKVAEDYYYTFSLDKGAHFYMTYIPSYLTSELFMECGMSYDASAIWGAITGLAYLSYIEINDGHSYNFGFSPSDFGADILGSGFFLAQHYSPFLQNFTPKFEYVVPSWIGQQHRDDPGGKPNPNLIFIDDYSTHTWWMSVNVHNLLPEKIQNYWPSWLELSFGYAVYSLMDQQYLQDPKKYDDFNGVAYGNRKLLIALDYNLSKLLLELFPKPNGTLGWIIQTLNYYKLPSPVLEIGKQTKFYLIYPFPSLGSFKF